MKKEKKAKYRNFQVSHELGDQIDLLQAAVTTSEKRKFSYEELFQKIVGDSFKRLEDKKEL